MGWDGGLTPPHYHPISGRMVAESVTHIPEQVWETKEAFSLIVRLIDTT